MKGPAPSLLPLLRSRAQGEIMAWLYLHPGEQFSLTELSVRAHTSVPTVQREANRLVDSGLVTERRSGNQRMLSATIDTPLYASLSELFARTFGPMPVLGRLLSGVDGIEQSFIYGSWAARYRGESGPVPADVDVIVIGDVDPDRLYDVSEAATEQLGREVNIRSTTASTWSEPNHDDPFIKSLRERPIVELEVDATPVDDPMSAA